MSDEKALSVERASTAIGTHGFAPENARQLMDMAEFVAKAGICPDALRGKPADCFVVMATGLEYGFTAMASLSMIHVVKGKPALSYEACLAKIQSHPDCEYVRIALEGKGEERCAVLRSKRKSRVEENEPIRFSIADARRAGLYDEKWRDRNGEPSVWVKYPDDQCVAKVTARSKRRDWADILPGLQVYEDLRELEPRIERNITPRPERKALEADPAIKALKALAMPKDEGAVSKGSEAAHTPPSSMAAAPQAASVASDPDVYEPVAEAPESLRKAVWERATQTGSPWIAAPLIEMFLREKFGQAGALDYLGEEANKATLMRAISVALNCRVDLNAQEVR